MKGIHANVSTPTLTVFRWIEYIRKLGMIWSFPPRFSLCIPSDCTWLHQIAMQHFIFSHLQPFSCFGSLLCPLCLLCYVQMTCDECQRHPLPGAIEPMAGEAGPSPDRAIILTASDPRRSMKIPGNIRHENTMDGTPFWNMSEKEVVNRCEQSENMSLLWASLSLCIQTPWASVTSQRCWSHW